MDYIELLGHTAACLTTLSFIPQAIKTIRTKDTKGISLAMYLAFSLGVLGWLLYGLAIHNRPVSIANGVTLCFALIILVYKIKYK